MIVNLHSNLMSWKSDIVVADGDVGWWKSLGIVGASLKSDFVKKFPIFTISPDGQNFRVSAGNARTRSHCTSAKLSSWAYERQKWIIPGSIQVGGKKVKIRFEVDTGYPPLALTPGLWDEMINQIHMRGGIVTDRVLGHYGRVVENCSSDTIPTVTMGIIDGLKIYIEASNFTKQTSPSQCLVYVAVFEPVLGYLYLGVPVLRSTETIFDSENGKIDFCA